MTPLVQRYLQAKKLQTNPEMGMIVMFEQMKRDAIAEIQKGLDAKVEHIVSKIQDGKDGYTPKKGKDYFTKDELDGIVNYVLLSIPTPENGKDADEDAIAKRVKAKIQVPKDGYTPQPGVDYPTTEQLQSIVYTEVASLFAMKPKSKKGVTKSEIDQLIGKLNEKIDFKKRAEEIARALETLQGNARLDYESLKNKPDLSSRQTKAVSRGGGEKTEYYDLSGLTDGVTKTFPIPRNKKVLLVLGTDSPAGQYRQTVDYTVSGSGNTVLTLTDAVMAPSSGATLHIIYVP